MCDKCNVEKPYKKTVNKHKKNNKNIKEQPLGFIHFHRIGPLGRFDHRVAKSVCLRVCMSPFHAIFSRPLIGPQIT